MALKDTLKTLFTYFEVEEERDREDIPETNEMTPETPRMRVAPAPQSTRQPEQAQFQEQVAPQVESRRVSRAQENRGATNLQRLHDKQQELLATNGQESKTSTIDIKFPKRYEDATEIVNLLLENNSVLIDFQYMSENQARRCLDYIDGARSVLSGSFKKVSNTMWLLTPVNVTVNVEDLRNSRSYSEEDNQFDFDMRR